MTRALPLVLALLLLPITMSCSDSMVGPEEATSDTAFKKGGKGGGNSGGGPAVDMVSFSVSVLQAGHGIGAMSLPTTHTAAVYPDSYTEVDFFGCPRADIACNEVTIRLSGGVRGKQLRARAAPLIVNEDLCFSAPEAGHSNVCAWDPDLYGHWGQGVSRTGLLWDGDAMTRTADGNYEITLYWQGQGRIMDPDGTLRWYFMPDLAGPADLDDLFIFRLGYDNMTLAAFCQEPNPDACYAQYTGEPGAPMYLVSDVGSISAGTPARGKRTATPPRARIDVQVFSEDIRENGALPATYPVTLNLVSNSRVMVVGPGGSRALSSWACAGAPCNADQPEIYANSHTVTLDGGPGCHFVYPIFATSNALPPNANAYSWDRNVDLAGAAPIGLRVDGADAFPDPTCVPAP